METVFPMGGSVAFDGWKQCFQWVESRKFWIKRQEWAVTGYFGKWAGRMLYLCSDKRGKVSLNFKLKNFILLCHICTSSFRTRTKR